MENRFYFPLYVDRSGTNPISVADRLGVDFFQYGSLRNGSHLALLENLGARWLRLHLRISWRELQPEEGGPIRWERLLSFENELRELKRLQVDPLVVVIDSPRWATINQPYPTSCGAIRQDKFQAFADFMQALTIRYSTEEFNVHRWELGNEPDVDPTLLGLDAFIGCWGDRNDIYYGGRHYGEMLKVVEPAIKAVDPSAEVWIGGLLLWSPATTGDDIGKPEMFFKGILESGAAPNFDVVAYHGYPIYFTDETMDNDIVNPWQEWGGIVTGKARYLQAVMEEYGVDKPLYANEVALMCPEYSPVCNPPGEVFFDAQANYLVRTFVRAMGAGVTGIGWFSLNHSGWRHTSLVDQNGGPKPVFLAYRGLISQLGDAIFLGEVDDYGPAIEAYAFRRGQEIVHLLWQRRDTSSILSIPEERFIGAMDRNGKSILTSRAEGSHQVTVTFEPLYLRLTLHP